jgi:galactose oxidase
MLDPVGAIVPGADVTVVTGNQFQGDGGNPGNQLQDGSLLLVRQQGDPLWAAQPMSYLRTDGNNKYYLGRIDSGAFQVGDVVEYYFRVAYDDQDTTYLSASGVTGIEAEARADPFTVEMDDPAVWGRWDPVFPLPDVGIHASVLPNSKVLMWGRRPDPADSLDVHECRPFVWDPMNGDPVPTPQPARADGTKVNLFCSGHTFLPDGRLLVVGGHQADSDGLDQAVLYDWRTNAWTASAPMTDRAGAPVRRWYPTATTLPDGTVLVMSGSFINPGQPPLVVDLLQIWDDGVWRIIDEGNGVPLTFVNPPLYPRLHVISTGEVFMSGTLQTTQRLKTSGPGAWTAVGDRTSGQRDYCPAVMYDRDRIVYIGGGNDQNTQVPTDRVEVIDLTANAPAWEPKSAMHFRRRQHNAVILHDGRLLVTGGTGGGGGPNRGFNDLNRGQPVHAAEAWDPGSAQWTALSAESVDRCYHSTAVLLPDARVLSAGGGEYRPDTVNQNDPLDSHRDAQIFSPPFLFRGPRPAITSAPDTVGYGDEFEIGTPEPGEIDAVNWIRLPSVTHSFEENQRINRLGFRVDQGLLKVTAPATANECPPGHYMLFLLDTAGVPSVAHVVQIQPAQAPAVSLLAIETALSPVTIEARAAEVEERHAARP